MSKSKVKPRRKRRYAVLLLLLLFAFLIYDGNTNIEVTEYELYYDNLPEQFSGFRVAALSDIHAAEFGGDNARLIQAVRDAKPDIIAVTGDLIDDDNQGEIVRMLMTGLVKIAPVYYVTGNHEWSSNGLYELKQILSDCGVIYLSNDYVRLTRGDDSIIIAGIDDPNGRYDQKTPGELITEIRGAEGDLYILLLAHRNEIEDYALLDVDTVLCGHAHGGIIRLPFLGGLIGNDRTLFPKYTEGVYSEGGMDMVVSRGLGNFSFVPRLFNNPHMPIIILNAR